MNWANASLYEWLVLAQHELLLFAGVFFIIGALDEFALDLIWFWLRLTGRARGLRVAAAELREMPLTGRCAVFVPTWREAGVIRATITHMRDAWRQDELRIYIGCYANDPATVAEAIDASAGDPRVRIVVHDRLGPTTKADCLNRLYRAMQDDEKREGSAFRSVMLHDAEDMVDPAALALVDRALAEAEFVQLPVLPAMRSDRRWIANHYADEFAESHGKAMVVRDALDLAIPAAGVGCAFSRDMMRVFAQQGDGDGAPFSVDSLTEDYELGLKVKGLGGRSRFLRVRGEGGRLIATRACFPDQLGTAVRQKTRWLHGIAFQGWDRLGWSGRVLDTWMLLRDRKGPLAAIVLAAAYLLLVISALIAALGWWTQQPAVALPPLLAWLVGLGFVSFAWRALMRFAFTSRDYGRTEGLLAILRIPLANIIAIMAARRAIMGYLRSLDGSKPAWDKTEHLAHPSIPRPAGAPA